MIKNDLGAAGYGQVNRKMLLWRQQWNVVLLRGEETWRLEALQSDVNKCEEEEEEQEEGSFIRTKHPREKEEDFIWEKSELGLHAPFVLTAEKNEKNLCLWFNHK